jgi:ferrous iron transport protein A
MSVESASGRRGGVALTLNQASVGQDFVIHGVEGPNCDRLRDLGFCESLRVKKLASGRNLICSVCGTRMAISRELAEAVRVFPL